MAETMKGTIDKFRRDRKAFSIGDKWYSAYKESWMGEAKAGDTVEFEYKRKGDFNNIEEGTLKVLDSAPAGGGGGGKSKGGGGGYSKGEFRSVPQLVRTDAVNQALTLLRDQGAQYATPKQAVRATLYVANVLAAYVDGEISVDGIDMPDTVGARASSKPAPVQHDAPAQQESPEPQQPEPAPQQEEAPASPAPSLDSFME